MTALIIKLATTAADRHIGRMAALALGLSMLEAVIPSPLPGGMGVVVASTGGKFAYGKFSYAGIFPQPKRCAMQHRHTEHQPIFAGALVWPGHPQYLRRICTHCWQIIIGVFLVYSARRAGVPDPCFCHGSTAVWYSKWPDRDALPGCTKH